MTTDESEGTPWIHRRMCSVCRKRLNRRLAPDGTTTYEHGYGGHDHEAKPVMEVDVKDMILVCDFCLEPHPMWDFGCANFLNEASITPDPSQDIGVALGDWAACYQCMLLVVSDDYEALADRCIEGNIKNNPLAAAAYKASPAVMMASRMNMMSLHKQFKDARTGPPTLIPDAVWIASKLRGFVGVESVEDQE